MRAYVAVTGALFALLTVLHLARSVELYHRAATDPGYVLEMALITLASAVLAVWAWRVFVRLGRSPDTPAA